MTRNNLVEGHVYFTCTWLTLSVPVPEIQSWIYVGLSDEKSEDGVIYLCFQDPESYFLNEILDELTEDQKSSYTKPKGPKLMRIKETELEGILYDLDGVKNWVKEMGTEPNAERIY